MPKVSAIIITYNRPIEILERAVLSVVNQTFCDTEIIIVNDNPENLNMCEQIKEMLSSFNDDRINYLSYEKNHGSNYARNYGLNKCHGELVAFLDDDDEWLPDKLEKQIKLFDNNKSLAIGYCGFYITDGDRYIERKPHHIKKNGLEEILSDNFIGSTSFPLLKTEYVRNVGGFDVNQKACQEHDLWIRLLEKYEANCLDECLGKYYLSKDSTFKNGKKFYEATLRIEKKHYYLYRKYPKSHHKMIINVMISMIKSKNYKYAVLCKKRAWKADFFNSENFVVGIIIKKGIKKYFKR